MQRRTSKLDIAFEHEIGSAGERSMTVEPFTAFELSTEMHLTFVLQFQESLRPVFLIAADIETFTDPKRVVLKMPPSTSCSLLSTEIVCRYGRRGQTLPMPLLLAHPTGT